YAYGYANTEQFKTELENQSGLNLNEFFEDWIYGEGYPSYHIDWFQDDDDKVHIVLFQNQSKPDVTAFFEGDLPIKIMGENNQSSEVVLNQTENEQHFVVDVDFAVNQIKIDPKTEIISKNNSTSLSVETYQL